MPRRNCTLTVFEGKLCDGSLDYLKKLQWKEKTRELYAMLDNMFPDLLNDEFLQWIARKVGQQTPRFAESYKLWKKNNFVETRGRKKLSLETMQIILNSWYDNSIPSVDCRNGRESDTIRKSLYNQRYHRDLHHEQPLLEKIKHNTCYYSCTRRIVTCTN